MIPPNRYPTKEIPEEDDDDHNHDNYRTDSHTKVDHTKREFTWSPPIPTPAPVHPPDDDTSPPPPFETCDISSPPENVLTKFGDAMVSDGERQAVTFTELTPDEAKEAKRKQDNFKWKQDFLINLEHGVPLVSLQDDICTLRGQNFACVSIIYGDSYKVLHCGEQQYRGDLIKIRGVFKMRENAARHKEMLLLEDPYTKVILMKCFSWNLLSDVTDDDESYQDKMNNIDKALRGYFENENSRVSGIQSRIDVVRSVVKQRSKESYEFHHKSIRETEEDKEEEANDSVFYETNKDRAQDLTEILHNLEKGVVPTQTPVIKLDADKETLVIPDQLFACISYIPPHEFQSETYPNREFDRPLLKIRGVFSSKEQAEDHIKQKIQPVDNKIDVSIVPCFRWAGLEDDAVMDRHYMTTESSDLSQYIREYFQNRNNVVYENPKERLLDAKRHQLAYAKQGVMDTNKLPFDIQLLPRLTTDQVKQLTEHVSLTLPAPLVGDNNGDDVTASSSGDDTAVVAVDNDGETEGADNDNGSEHTVPLDTTVDDGDDGDDIACETAAGCVSNNSVVFMSVKMKD